MPFISGQVKVLHNRRHRLGMTKIFYWDVNPQSTPDCSLVMIIIILDRAKTNTNIYIPKHGDEHKNGLAARR